MTSETTISPASVPDPAALHMGRRLTRRRNDLRLSRRWLASLLGIAQQECRAWEEGWARMDGKTLHDLSVLLDVPMTYFVEGLEVPYRPKRLETLLQEHLTRTLLQTAVTAPPVERRARLLQALESP
ncbi:helix-turn-helix domain-containing protein [Rhodospirillum sp. A1_3_36]|uniref:helix-turn-helix domain-containing protein n=1 Tax=Rhodospirillum sp. A1_3_36 TaxID=3391666 RepID=UPI0039A5DA05